MRDTVCLSNWVWAATPKSCTHPSVHRYTEKRQSATEFGDFSFEDDVPQISSHRSRVSSRTQISKELLPSRACSCSNTEQELLLTKAAKGELGMKNVRPNAMGPLVSSSMD